MLTTMLLVAEVLAQAPGSVRVDEAIATLPDAIDAGIKSTTFWEPGGAQCEIRCSREGIVRVIEPTNDGPSACESALLKEKGRTEGIAFLFLGALVAFITTAYGSRQRVLDAWVRSEFSLPNNIRGLAYLFLTPVIAGMLGGGVVRMGAWFAGESAPTGLYAFTMVLFLLIGGLFGGVIAVGKFDEKK